MPDYKQTTINGTSWKRAWRVECENPLQGQRKITFHEEQVLNAGEQQIRTPTGNMSVRFDTENALTTFPLLDPDTGAQLGTATYAQVYRILHSLYMHSAAERDALTESLAAQPDTEELPEGDESIE